MNIKSLFLINCLIFYQISLFSQDTAQVKITTYQPYITTTIDPVNDRKIFKNNIKWNISMLGRGAFLINYERLITKKISLESGISLNYRDYILEGDWQDNNYFFPPENKEAKAKIGIGFEFAPRFYPKEGNLEGLYISPAIRYRSYNVSVINPRLSGNTFEGEYDVSYQTTDLAFIIGSQWESFILECTAEYYFGVGYRQNAYKKVTEDSGIIEFEDKTEMYPCILFGFKLGVNF